MRSLAHSFFRSACKFRSTNSARTSLGGTFCTRLSASKGMRRCLQNWCQDWRHSSSSARSPLRMSLCRACPSDQSMRQGGCFARALAAMWPGLSGSASAAPSCRTTVRARPSLSGLSPPAPEPGAPSPLLPAGGPASEDALGLVPTALKARAATASQRNRTTPSRSHPSRSDTWAPASGSGSSSRTSKASRRPSNLRSVLGSRLCGGQSPKLGWPKSPSSGPRCATKSRNARASGQFTIGHWCNSSCSCGLDLPPVRTGCTGAVALLSAETRRTCKSSLSLSAARLAARQSVAL
mmetsp:Transcript_64625/g.192536  ORF Transcript_64625/g.192536 Transcript_64625/m.192536 type:complete len:294 (+) Transcript_64625:760-1641(+)